MLPYHDSWLSRVQSIQLVSQVCSDPLCQVSHRHYRRNVSTQGGFGDQEHAAFLRPLCPQQREQPEQRATRPTSGAHSSAPRNNREEDQASHASPTGLPLTEANYCVTDNRTADDWVRILHEAAEEGKEDYCALLVHRGIPVDGRDMWTGATALHRCIASCLIRDGWSGWGCAPRTLVDDTDARKLRAAHILLAFGADVEAKDQNGMSPLVKAVQRGHIRMVRLLLSHLADAGGECGISASNRDTSPIQNHGGSLVVRPVPTRNEAPGYESTEMAASLESTSTRSLGGGRSSFTEIYPLQACFVRGQNEDAEGPKLALVQMLCSAGAPAHQVVGAVWHARRLVQAREHCLQRSIASGDLDQFVWQDQMAVEDANQVLHYLEAKAFGVDVQRDEV